MTRFDDADRSWLWAARIRPLTLPSVMRERIGACAFMAATADGLAP